jgi:hypothetical protein
MGVESYGGGADVRRAVVSDARLAHHEVQGTKADGRKGADHRFGTMCDTRQADVF